MATKTRKDEPPSAGDWLDAELREAKARLHKLEGELDQALKHVWAMDADLRKLTEALAASGSVAATLVTLREEVRQLHDQSGRLQDRQAALGNRMEELVRSSQAAAARDRNELAAISKQVEALGRAIGQYESRMQAMEDVARHLEEEIAGVRLASQGIERAQEEMATRVARLHETSVRLEQEAGRVAAEVEKLKKVDEELLDHLRLQAEQSRRLSERLDKVEPILAFPDEAREALHRAALEREQLTQRLAVMERLAADISEQAKEFTQTAARLDQRHQHLTAQVMQVTGQLQEVAEQTSGQTKRIFQVLVRQRKRQADTIVQEIKELSHGELHAGD